MKRLFDFQKGVQEVTLTLDYNDYVNLMATLKTASEITEEEKHPYIAEQLKWNYELIESIEPEYIWDEI